MPIGNTAQNYQKGDYARAEGEWYVEPSWCVDLLIDAVDFARTIYDPACGLGTIPETFRRRGMLARGSDIVDRGWDGFAGTHDFLTGGIPDNIPCESARVDIVTNPPYNLTEEFVRTALSSPRVGKVAIIQQLKFLASQGRHRLFTEYAPVSVLVLSSRPSMPPGAKIEEMGDKAFRGGVHDYCWIVWDRLRVGAPTEMRWLKR
jgi:hypothetical protein